MLIKIALLNARGLSLIKLNMILLLLNNFDIIINETWYSQATTQALSHPAAIATTTSSHSVLSPRYHHHGILILASPLTHAAISVTQRAEHSISLLIHGTNVHCIYAPPSLPIASFDQILQEAPIRPDIVIGDLNARFGKRFDDNHTGPSDRVSSITRYISRYHLHHLTPSSGKTRVDHVLAAPSLQAEIHNVPSPFPN
jgi:hypothetical protein